MKRTIVLLMVSLLLGCGKDDPQTAAMRRAENAQREFESANKRAEKRLAQAQARAAKQQEAFQKRSEELTRKSEQVLKDRSAREVKQKESESSATSQPS